MAMLLRLCCSRPWQWERGKIPAGSRWQSSLITPLAGWFWRHSGGYGGLHRQAHGERRQQQENDVTTRDGSVAAAMSPRAEVGVRGMGRAGGVRGDEMGIRVGGRTEGQSVWTTEIKGAGTHETEGIAVEGWFQTDDEAVSGGWAYFFFFLCPCLGPLYPQAYMGIQFNCIINAFWLHCVCHTIARPQPPCPLARRRARLFTKNQSSHWKCVINPYSMCLISCPRPPHSLSHTLTHRVMHNR